MENSDNINHRLVSPTVDQKVPGCSDDASIPSGPIAAEEQMVSAHPVCQLRPLTRTRTFRIGRDVAKRLFQKSPIARGGPFAEFLLTPFQSLANIDSCGRRENDPE